MERWATGISERKPHRKGGHEGNRESGLSPSQVSAAYKCTAGEKWNPHQASETQVGWEAALLWLGLHILACVESWVQQQGRDGCGKMPRSRSSQLPPSATTCHRSPVYLARSSSKPGFGRNSSSPPTVHRTLPRDLKPIAGGSVIGSGVSGGSW